jgi:hypothetical protein
MTHEILLRRRITQGWSDLHREAGYSGTGVYALTISGRVL